MSRAPPRRRSRPARGAAVRRGASASCGVPAVGYSVFVLLRATVPMRMGAVLGPDDRLRHAHASRSRRSSRGSRVSRGLRASRRVLLFGPEVGAVTLALDGLRISFRWKMNRQQTVFNFANLGLSMWLSGQLFFLVSGTGPLYSAAPPSATIVLVARGAGGGVLRRQQRPHRRPSIALSARGGRSAVWLRALLAAASELPGRRLGRAAAGAGVPRGAVHRDRADPAAAAHQLPDAAVVLRPARGFEGPRRAAEPAAAVHRRDARDGDRREGRGHARSHPPRAAGHARARARARRDRRRHAQGARGGGAAARHRQDRGARSTS